MSVELVGEYYADSYARHEARTVAVGWEDLMIGTYIAGRAAPYRIDRHGTAIGWAPSSSLRLKGATQITLGMIVITL
jgi:hypothetical protein